MIIMGIDPGTAITGFGALNQEGNRLRSIDYGVIRTTPDLSGSQRLKIIYQQVTELIKRFSPQEIAVERLFFSKNTRTAFDVGEARGVILLAAAMQGVEIMEYTPLQVKMAVVGYGRADKRQVQEMVRVLLGLKVIPKPDDAADALAMAICHAHCRGNGLLKDVKR